MVCAWLLSHIISNNALIVSLFGEGCFVCPLILICMCTVRFFFPITLFSCLKKNELPTSHTLNHSGWFQPLLFPLPLCLLPVGQRLLGWGAAPNGKLTEKQTWASCFNSLYLYTGHHFMDQLQNKGNVPPPRSCFALSCRERMLKVRMLLLLV